MTDTRIFEGWEPSDQRFVENAPEEGVITLTRGPRGARVEGVPRRWVVHSPTGFEWGYGGSGPADLALNILGMFVPAPEAWRLHHDLKFAVLVQVPRDVVDFEIDLMAIRMWIEEQWA